MKKAVMHEYERVIRVADTDASGVIYFANVQSIALEAFEDFLHLRGYSLNTLFEESAFLLPIVHAEADYFSPIKVSEVLSVRMRVANVGTSSITMISYLYSVQSGLMVATAKMTHVVMCRCTKTAIPIPAELTHLLQDLL